MDEKLNYNKLPWWWRWFYGQARLLCWLGLHVPVKSVDLENKNYEVFCQNCIIEMTEAEHERFFAPARI